MLWARRLQTTCYRSWPVIRDLPEATLRRTRSAASSGEVVAFVASPAEFDGGVLTFDVAGFAQALSERSQKK